MNFGYVFGDENIEPIELIKAKEKIQKQMKGVIDFQVERALFPKETIEEYNQRMEDRYGQNKQV